MNDVLVVVFAGFVVLVMLPIMIVVVGYTWFILVELIKELFHRG